MFSQVNPYISLQFWLLLKELSIPISELLGINPVKIYQIERPL